MMVKRMTRQMAAETLGVSKQTVSNYIEEGLLGSCKEHGIVYVNAEDVERHKEKYEMIAAGEEALDSKKMEIEELNGKADAEIMELRKELATGGLPLDLKADIVSMVQYIHVAGVEPRMNERENGAIVAFLNGGLEGVADAAGLDMLTRERRRQVVRKACGKLMRQIEAVGAIVGENLSLKDRTAALEKENAELRLTCEAHNRLLAKYGVEEGKVAVPEWWGWKTSEIDFCDGRMKVRVHNAVASYPKKREYKGVVAGTMGELLLLIRDTPPSRFPSGHRR